MILSASLIGLPNDQFKHLARPLLFGIVQAAAGNEDLTDHGRKARRS
jgi:hypothetical protein